MKKLDGFSGIQRELARALRKPVLYLSWDPTWEYYDLHELLKAAPMLDANADFQSITEGYLYVICDSLEEMYELYNRVVGDDGPTKENPYNGPAGVYARTCDAFGVLLNENT